MYAHIGRYGHRIAGHDVRYRYGKRRLAAVAVFACQRAQHDIAVGHYALEVSGAVAYRHGAYVVFFHVKRSQCYRSVFHYAGDAGAHQFFYFLVNAPSTVF